MDFSTSRTQSQPRPASAGSPASLAAPTHSKHNKSSRNKWLKVTWGILLVAVVILLVGLVAVIGFGGPKAESSYINKDKLQAVFLNTGQVYFGNIDKLNSKYLVLDNIYYLQTSSASTTDKSTDTTNNSNVSLVKLGCELHAPYDTMVINRDQVTFWENLKSDGQVATAVKTFQQQNPNGQKCSTNTTNSNSTNVQGTSTPTTNSTTSTGTSTTNNTTNTKQ